MLILTARFIDRMNKKISSISSNNQKYEAKCNHKVAECN